MTASPQTPQKNSSSGFGELFDIVFSREDRIFAETSSAVRRLSYTAGEVKSDALNLASAICGYGLEDRWVGIFGEDLPSLAAAFWAVLRSGNRPCLLGRDTPDEAFAGLNGAFIIDCDGTLTSAHPHLTYGELMAQSSPCRLPEFGRVVAVLSETPVLLTPGDILSRPCLFSLAKRERLKVLSLMPMNTEFWLADVFLRGSLMGAVFVFPQDKSSAACLHTARKHLVTHIFVPASLWHTVEKTALGLASPKEIKRLRFISRLPSPRLARFASGKLLSGLRQKLLGDRVKACFNLSGELCSTAEKTLKGLGYTVTDSGLELQMPVPEEKTAAVPAPESTGDSAVGTILREIMADILAVDETEITENGHFMRDLGGSSLDYFTLLGEINNRFGVTLDFESEKFGYTLKDFERVVTELIS